MGPHAPLYPTSVITYYFHRSLKVRYNGIVLYTVFLSMEKRIGLFAVGFLKSRLTDRYEALFNLNRVKPCKSLRYPFSLQSTAVEERIGLFAIGFLKITDRYGASCCLIL